MRTALVFGALAALVTAIPFPQYENPEPEHSVPEPTLVLGPASTSLYIPVTDAPEPTDTPEWEWPSTSKRRTNPHWEPIPVFSSACMCDLATVAYPCWATDALERCHYEENFSYICYMQAHGGCAKGTRTCTNLFKPTPRPGRHPCLGPQETPDPTTTTELVLTTAITIGGPGANPTAAPSSTELVLTTIITVGGPSTEPTKAPGTTSDLVLTTIYPTKTVTVEGPEETITVTAEGPGPDRETITVGAPEETTAPSAPSTGRETITLGGAEGTATPKFTVDLPKPEPTTIDSFPPEETEVSGPVATVTFG